MKNFKINSAITNVLLLQLLFTSGCVTFHFSENKKFRNFFPVKDFHAVTSSELQSHTFDPDLSFHPDTNSSIQYISPESIKLISEKIGGSLLLIVYYPNCPSASDDLEIAKYAEDHLIPFILVSDI